MGLAVFRPDKLLHLVRKRNQSEQIALLLGRQPEHQRGGEVPLENGCAKLLVPGCHRKHAIVHRILHVDFGTLRSLPCAQPRCINHHVDFLGPLDLKHLGNRLAATRRSLPVNFIVSVTGHVFAQLFELASLPQLPLGVQPERRTL